MNEHMEILVQEHEDARKRLWTDVYITLMDHGNSNQAANFEATLALANFDETFPNPLLENPMITEQNLQQEVARWSLNNFGDQTSKITNCPLDSLAPLLGIMEECLDELVSASTPEEARDALGDICIYTCDFASRDSPYLDLNNLLCLIDYDELFDETLALSTLCKALGRLCHCVLKRHQGIRGYSDNSKYTAERDLAVSDLLFCAPFVVGIKQPIMNFGIDTFTKIVSKRNWVDNPQGVE